MYNCRSLFLNLRGDSDKFSFTLRYRLQERERLTTIAIAIVGSVISVITLERAIEK